MKEYFEVVAQIFGIIFKILLKIFIPISALVIIWIMILFTTYRLPSNEEPVTISGEYMIRILNFDLSSRNFFEESVGNGVFRLDGRPQFYASPENMTKIKSQKAWEMAEKGFTLKMKITVQPLFFGGYDLAEITHFEWIEKKPIRHKY